MKTKKTATKAAPAATPTPPPTPIVDGCSAPPSPGCPWSLGDVERLVDIMTTRGVNLVEMPGLKVIRSPQERFHDQLGKRAAEIEKNEKGVTDADILMDPFAGMDVNPEAERHG